MRGLSRRLSGLAVLLSGAVLALYLGFRSDRFDGGLVAMVREPVADLSVGKPGSPVNSTGATPCYAQIDSTPHITYTSVQDAVDAASNGETVKVAGTCGGVETRAGVTQTVYISKTLTLRGGYTTTNWITPDAEANPTMLDALGQGRVLYITGDISPTIEGLRITGGDVHRLGDGCLGSAGGGVYVMTATATIRGTEVFSNSAHRGGGVYLHSSAATLSGSTVHGNTATEGGGIYLELSAATLSANTVVSNTASGVGGGLYLYSSPSTLSGNTVAFNTAVYGGGGAYLNASAATLSGNTVYGNGASGGGGLYLTCYSAATLSGNTISDNRADDGGGLYLWEADTTLTNNMVLDNQAATGSGLYISGSSAYLLHTTIACNASGDGNAVYITGCYDAYHSSVALTNTVLVSHAVGITVTQGNTATLEGTLWYGNRQDTGGEGTIITGTVNTHGDPAFASPDAGDYHIGPGSAALDQGVNAGVTTDIDGEPRPMRSGYDIGADEQPPSPVASFASSSPDWVGQTTRFTNTTVVTGAVSYVWAFGDRVTSTVVSPTHAYTVPGSYTVALTATNNGGSSVATDTVTIHAASFSSSSPDWLGETTVFTNTTAGSGAISYTWDLGDGEISTQEHLTHTYTAPARYTVTLTATDLAGSDTATDTVAVYGSPTVGFTAHPTQGARPLTTLFTDSTTTTPPGDPTLAYLWCFGDGAGSTLPNPTHTYTETKVYTVSLTVSNTAGSDTLARTRYISVWEEHDVYLPLILLTLTLAGCSVMVAQSGGTPLIIRALCEHLRRRNGIPSDRIA